jgi:hypothetical protein
MGSIGDKIWEDQQLEFEAKELDRKTRRQKNIANEILREKPTSKRMEQVFWIRENFKKIMAMRHIIEKLEL